ncbi:MAG: response regulator transcription factor [Planctomycetota bacterium]|nr:response regulator transcription factor [Planctomycetota bacterium]
MSRPRVLLADDHPVLLRGLESMLAEEFDVVGTAGDGKALIAAAGDLRPDVAVIDIAMPEMSGLDALQRLAETAPRCRVIVLSMHEDPDVVAAAVDAGAAAFVAKSDVADGLFTAIRSVVRGESWISPRLRPAVEAAPPAAAKRKPLTPRQREVLDLLAKGRSMKQVAYDLGITARTVAFHKYKIMEEHGLESNAELFQLAMREGLG